MKLPLANMMRALLLVTLVHPFLLVRAADCSEWPAWNNFRAHFLSEDGRVIDHGMPNKQTTSEGQAYGLFFALVANDQKSFSRILSWTERNLSNDDLTARLPAWQWGGKVDGSWGVLDSNSAADADLWLAYTLIEAGRLWKNPKYNALGELLAERIIREETAQLSGLGATLLPGSQGFRPQEGTVRLNPSYMPLQIMRRMSALHPRSAWQNLTDSTIKVIVRSSPTGFAPDWVLYKIGQGFQADTGTQAKGSYDAIRVYLWSGMLDKNEPMRNLFIRTFSPMVQYVGSNGVPPLDADAMQGGGSGTGPTGFSAALLPFLDAAKKPELVRQQRMRIAAQSPLDRSENYFEQTLVMFGLGWMDGHYRFAKNGTVIPRWVCQPH